MDGHDVQDDFSLLKDPPSKTSNAQTMIFSVTSQN